MSIAIVGTVGTLAAAGYGAYSTYSSNKAQKEAQQAAVNGANFGRTPEAALYEPVDFNEEQLAAILTNTNALDSIRGLMKGTNRMITNDAIRRADKLIPGYSASMRQMGLNANDLINARLPSDIVEKVFADRAGVSGGVNIPGLAGPATLKDLGLTSLDAMNMGTGMLGKMVNMAETISPRAMYMRPQDSMISPSERIRLTMEQNALNQQSDQNANNLAAGMPPGEMARLGLNLSHASQPGVDWGSTGASMAQALIQGYRQYQQDKAGAGGGYNASTGFYTNPSALASAAPYAGGYSYTPGMGYTPRATAV